MEVTAEQEIEQIRVGKPHLVILGAGASFAAFPNGDKNGRHLPLMDNLVQILNLEQEVNASGLKFDSENFESIYSKLHEAPEQIERRRKIESKVYNYFAGLKLPECPTIYDHLVLSLRNKDFVATFNWDPFLVQAIRRNAHRFNVPKPLFLHGNVEVAYCEDGHCMGNIGGECGLCGKQLTPTKLLYPVLEKNYDVNEFISRQWKTISDVFNHAFMVTVFGYGAPSSDVKAVELMKQSWGKAAERQMEEFEVIDIKDEDEVRETWSSFIHTHHYRVESSFYDSWIARHPRRTGEAYVNQFFEAKFIEDNPLPVNANFSELWCWYDRLQQVENGYAA